METHFNKLLHQIYYLLKLNTMILLGLLAGGCGLSALATGVEMHIEAKGEAQQLKFKRWWGAFVSELKRSALSAWIYNFMILFLLWAIWFTSQFRGLIFLAALFIQITTFVFAILAMLAEAHLRQYYEGAWGKLMQVSWIQIFMSPKANFITLGLGIFFVVVMKQMPAIVMFWAFGLWVYVTTSIYKKEWSRLNLL